MALEFRPPDREIIERIWEEFGLDETRIKEAVEAIRKWLTLQPHLPKENDSIHDARLERWLIRCKNSIERTKQSIDMYYTTKTMVPEISSGFDIKGEWFETACKLTYYMPMAELTPERDRIIVLGLQSPDPTNLISEDWFKVAIMTTEVRMCEDYCLRDILVYDLANYTIGHIPKLSLPLLKKGEIYIIKGFNTRLKALHFINAPPYADVLIGLMKSVLKAKLAQRVHVHGSDLTLLHKEVPKKCLPTEAGGDAGSVADNWALWKKKLESYRGWFLEHDKFKSDEKKRPGGNFNCSEVFGFEGSFRKLSVD